MIRAYRATLLVSVSPSTKPDDVLGQFVLGLGEAEALSLDTYRFPGGQQVEVMVRFAADSDEQALSIATAARESVLHSGGMVRSADSVKVRRGRLSAVERASLALDSTRIVQVTGRKR